MDLWLFNYGWCCESWCLEIGFLGHASGCKRRVLVLWLSVWRIGVAQASSVIFIL